MRNGGDSMIKTAFYDTKEYDNLKNMDRHTI